MDRDVLILGVENGGIANRLRFYLPKLKEDLKRFGGFKALNKLEVMILPPELLKKPLPPEPKVMSDEARDMVKSASENVDDPSLKAALEKLAGD